VCVCVCVCVCVYDLLRENTDDVSFCQIIWKSTCRSQHIYLKEMIRKYRSSIMQFLKWFSLVWQMNASN